jgi:predicted TPR repeat methyltransferase
VGVAARRAGMHDVAQDFLQRVLALDNAHVLARRLLLTLRPRTSDSDAAAALGVSSVADDAAYARMLFDSDPQGYEAAMLTDLQYRAPARLLSMLQLAPPAPPAPPATKPATPATSTGLWGRVVDAGCGSGLMGDLLRPLSRRVIGIDIAPAMVLAARGRRVQRAGKGRGGGGHALGGGEEGGAGL